MYMGKKILVDVKPNSKENKIEKLEDGEYKVYVKEPAEDNRANKAVIKLIAKEFNVSWRLVSIKNPTSRKKIIEIEI